MRKKHYSLVWYTMSASVNTKVFGRDLANETFKRPTGVLITGVGIVQYLESFQIF